MQKTIEKLIPAAYEAVQEKLVETKDGKKGVPSGYNGYIASLGASIIQMGLLPTIAVFSNENANTQEKRPELLKAIEQVLKIKGGLFNAVLACQGDRQKSLVLKKAIINASIAIKLSLRTFEKLKNENSKGGDNGSN
ncbi:MAG: hypothetical protein JNM36_12685 [Chitinophagales bacterium]|nr:hypothetical protein [Chitinophagales bacterium]